MGGWLLAACGGDDDDTGAAATGATPTGGGEIDVVNWALTGDAPAIDYAKAYDFNTNGVVTNITEPLLLMNPEGELQPNLAEEWELTEPTTMVIKLRSGVKFHDGTDMTAEDVAFSLNRHRDPDVGSFLATFHDRVKNVEATGPLDITITFTRPDAHFPYALATMAAAVASKAFMEANGNKVGTPGVGIIGTGPYKFTSWTKGQEIVIDRFDDYWNTDRAMKVKQFVSKILLDEATVVQALQTGEIDGIWGNNISGKGAKAAQSFDTVNVLRGPSYGIHYLAMNTQKPRSTTCGSGRRSPWRSTRKGCSSRPGEAWARPGSSRRRRRPCGPSRRTPSSRPTTSCPASSSMSRARRPLSRSRRRGRAGRHSQLAPYDAEQAIAIQAAGEEIGLNLTPKKVEFTEKLTAELSGKPTRTYSSTATQWASDIPDPAGQLFVLFHSKNLVTNNTAYKNPQVDDLLDRQRDSTDQAERADLLTQAQAMIVEDQPDAIFYSPDTILVMNKRLTGYDIRPLWYWDPFVADLSGA